MQIYFGSDLHLEFHKANTPALNIPVGDVLLLAGDIFLPWDTNKIHKRVVEDFFTNVNERFNHVLLIAGNHEHYGGYFIDTHTKIEEWIDPYKNIHLLNSQTYQVGEIMVFGSTFWTDMRGSHPEIMWDVKRGMSDYHEVRYSEDRYTPYKSGGPKLMPEDTVNENHYARKKLSEFMTKAEEMEMIPIVMTHHAPTFECVEQCYRMDNLSYAYANTGMDDLLLDLYPPHIWVHGHMHKREMIRFGKSTILTNARGYVGMEPTHSFEFKQINITPVEI